MTLRWTPKDPVSSLEYSIDWSQYLGASPINTVDWFIFDENGVKTEVTPGTPINGLTFIAFSNTNDTCTVLISGGVLNRTYRIVNAITFSDQTQNTERTITLQIRDQ